MINLKQIQSYLDKNTKLRLSLEEIERQLDLIEVRYKNRMTNVQLARTIQIRVITKGCRGTEVLIGANKSEEIGNHND